MQDCNDIQVYFRKGRGEEAFYFRSVAHIRDVHGALVLHLVIMAKVVFLKLDYQASSLVAFTTDLFASTAHERGALVVSRSPDGFLEIRGHTPACKDRHKAWCVFCVSLRPSDNVA